MGSAVAQYGRSPTDYMRDAGRSASGVPITASGGREENLANLTDGRFFGDELFAELFQPNSAATADAAAKISAVYFCVSLIAEAIGNCPIDFLEGGKKVESFDVADVLSNGPNPIQTAAEFWPSMLFRAALAGHAFAEPVVSAGELTVWPLHPDRISVDWRERGFTVHYQPELGEARMFNASQLFWISGLADARMQPLCPWKMAKGALDFALALENQGRRFFQNHKRIPGTLETDNKLDEDVIERLERGIKKWRDGQTPVLEQGLKFKSAASSNVESQFVELLDQRTQEMARYWRIPRSFYADGGANAKSAEQEAQAFVKYTARPWARRVEQAIRQRILTPDQRSRIKVQVNLDALLRGDSATQWKNAVLARTASILSVDEIRETWFGIAPIGEAWSQDARTALNSNRAADTITGGQTAPQDNNEEDRDQ